MGTSTRTRAEGVPAMTNRSAARGPSTGPDASGVAPAGGGAADLLPQLGAARDAAIAHAAKAQQSRAPGNHRVLVMLRTIGPLTDGGTVVVRADPARRDQGTQPPW